jgi:uncharacterized protein YbjT (DUF2867 family)
VIGASGAQGGSVARALLDAGWPVRAFTRHPTSAPVRDLRQAGAEIVSGDLADAESVRRAVAGVDALFLATDYWSLGAEREYQYGRQAVEFALEAGVRHVVHSSLPEANERTRGELSLPHHDGKARLETELRRLNGPVTWVHLSTYYENWPTRRLQRQSDGSLMFTLPYGDLPLPSVAVSDLGGVVKALISGGSGWFGETVKVVGDLLRPSEYARILTDVLGVQVRYRDLSYGEFRQLPIPNAVALADMLEYSRRYDRHREPDLQLTRRLYPEVRTFSQWARPDRFAALLQPTG